MPQVARSSDIHLKIGRLICNMCHAVEAAR
jgi:hypothetical protein